MEMTYRAENRQLTISLKGELDHHAARGVMDSIDRCMEQNLPVKTVLDLGGLTFMDSSGIGVVMGRYNTVRIAGGNIYVTGCDPYVERLLEMAGIWLITTKMATVEEALAASRERRRNNG